MIPEAIFLQKKYDPSLRSRFAQSMLKNSNSISVTSNLSHSPPKENIMHENNLGNNSLDWKPPQPALNNYIQSGRHSLAVMQNSTRNTTSNFANSMEKMLNQYSPVNKDAHRSTHLSNHPSARYDLNSQSQINAPINDHPHPFASTLQPN